MNIKIAMHLAAFLCLKALRVAEIGPDHSHTWTVPLAHLKSAFLPFLQSG